jgi:hypothetical protein
MPNHNFFRLSARFGGNILRRCPFHRPLEAALRRVIQNNLGRPAYYGRSQYRLRVRRSSSRVAEIALQVFAPFPEATHLRTAGPSGSR